MSLNDIVTAGIAAANTITDSLQVTIKHYAWIKDDRQGKPVYSLPIKRKALLEPWPMMHRQHRTAIATAGTDTLEVKPKAKLTFLTEITKNGAKYRHEPIDPRDKLVLPDETTGPILDVRGLTDPATGLPYMYEVLLG